MGKTLPWYKRYPDEYLNDPCLRMCTLATKGFWAHLCDVMNRDRMPTISGTYEQVARLVGCTEQECVTACNDLKQTKTADVTLGESVVSITSRRIQREENQRLGTRLRVQRYREKKDVTPAKRDGYGVDRDIDREKETLLTQSKESDGRCPSSIDDCRAYFAELGHPSEAQGFWDYWTEQKWSRPGKKRGEARLPIVSWRGTARTWCRKVKKDAQPSTAPTLKIYR